MPRHHKLGLLLLLLGSVAHASQSLSAGSGSGTLPNSVPFTNLSTFRIEFRVHGPWNISTIQSIYGSNSFAVRTVFGGFTLTSWQDGSAICTVSPAAGHGRDDSAPTAEQRATDGRSLRQPNRGEPWFQPAAIFLARHSERRRVWHGRGQLRRRYFLRPRVSGHGCSGHASSKYHMRREPDGFRTRRQRQRLFGPGLESDDGGRQLHRHAHPIAGGALQRLADAQHVSSRGRIVAVSRLLFHLDRRRIRFLLLAAASRSNNRCVFEPHGG